MGRNTKVRVVKKVMNEPTKDSATKSGAEEKYVVEKIVDRRFVEYVY
jgi:hypothetical protein